GLGHGELGGLHRVGIEPGQTSRGPDDVSDQGDVVGFGWDQDLDVGPVGHASCGALPRASPRDANTGKTLASPVMSKIFMIRSCVTTSFKSPSFDFTRFRPPTRTPRPVESRKSTRSMSTTMSLAPPSTRSMRACRSRGAV